MTATNADGTGSSSSASNEVTIPAPTISGSVRRVRVTYPSAPVSSFPGGLFTFSQLGVTNLRNGSTGEPVSVLQTFLNNVLKTSLAIDGILGPKTTAAFKIFQSAHGLVPDGIVGPLTKAEMQKI